MTANADMNTVDGERRHLPECECYGRNHGECALCICAALRACEQRVHAHHLARDLDDVRFGRKEGLREAREAVTALLAELEANHDEDRHDGAWEALAAIDGFIEEKS